MFIIILFIILKKEKKERRACGLISQNIFGQQITTTKIFQFLLTHPTCLSSLFLPFILFFHSLLSLGFSSNFSYTPHDNSTPQQLLILSTPTTFSPLLILLICILLCQKLCPIKPTLGFPCSAMIEASWSILFHLVKQLPCCCLLAP